MLEMLMAMERTKKRSRTTRSTIMDCLLGVYLNVSCEVQVSEETTSGERNNNRSLFYHSRLHVVRSYAVCEGQACVVVVRVCGVCVLISVVVNLQILGTTKKFLRGPVGPGSGITLAGSIR